jgi:beta-agarase
MTPTKPSTTNFFSLRQNESGAWSFVDPQGRPFVSLALNHLDDSDLRYPYNVKVFEKKYGSRKRWTEGVVRDLQDLEFNTIG